MEMLEEKKYSTEAITALEIVESLSEMGRRVVLEKLRVIAAEETDDEKWDRFLKEQPEPAIRMAEQALKDDAAGKSRPLSFD